ncbi:MAG TPA: zeta toxin family protein [Acidimicrobiales bacterium]|nr:zeta toxin family protein [Acidimicrobiales bacterium]
MANVIVIYGPPGSGKSTLAKALAQDLALPCFDRDEFKDLLFDTLGYSDRSWSRQVGAASWALLRLTVNKLADTGQSFIVETNFRPGDAPVEELRALHASGAVRVVSIQVVAAREVLWERFDGRHQGGGRHPGHVGFETADEFAHFLAANPHGAIDFGGPTLDIDTSAGWPNTSDVVSWVRTALSDDAS